MEDVLAYLSRLTGETITADQAVQMRSVHRAAFTSWARKQNLSIRHDLMNAGKPVLVRELLGAEPVPQAATLPGPPPAIHGQPAVVLLGIGIDIEEVENLPEAADYREHAFFQDHFTGVEIAYCLRQADPRLSFAGIWAAKEAVLKAGLIPSHSRLMKDFEITRDEQGRPQYPGCHLSISHTAKVAVAVCVAMTPVPVEQPISSAPIPACAEPSLEPSPRKWPWRRSPAPKATE